MESRDIDCGVKGNYRLKDLKRKLVIASRVSYEIWRSAERFVQCTEEYLETSKSEERCSEDYLKLS